MDALKHIIPILLTLSLALVVIAIGMVSVRNDLVYVLRRPSLLMRALLAVCIIPLISSIIILMLFPLSPPTRAGLLLMAISPVPPLVPIKGIKFGGRREYVYGLETAMALLAVVTVPLLGALTARFYEVDVRFPLALVAENVFVGVVLPLVIGLALGRWLAPNFSQRWASTASYLGTTLALAAFVPIVIGAWPQIIVLVGNGSLAAIAVVIAIALAGGHLLGGPAIGDRAALAFASATRHPGIALALAGANYADKPVSAAVLLVMLVGTIVLIPYQIAIKHHLSNQQF